MLKRCKTLTILNPCNDADLRGLYMPGHLSTYAHRATLVNRNHLVLQRRREDVQPQAIDSGKPSTNDQQFPIRPDQARHQFLASQAIFPA